MLAAFAFASYSNVLHRLERGDRLLLYTDGIVEASNASGDFFGHDALCGLLKRTGGFSSSEAADSIMGSVRQWSAKQEDDPAYLRLCRLEQRNSKDYFRELQHPAASCGQNSLLFM
jgi:phosphoserine phosphatase RsbU/P